MSTLTGLTLIQVQTQQMSEQSEALTWGFVTSAAIRNKYVATVQQNSRACTFLERVGTFLERRLHIFSLDNKHEISLFKRNGSE